MRRDTRPLPAAAHPAGANGHQVELYLLRGRRKTQLALLPARFRARWRNLLTGKLSLFQIQRWAVPCPMSVGEQKSTISVDNSVHNLGLSTQNALI